MSFSDHPTIQFDLDHLQYTRAEGEGLVHLNDVSFYLDIQGREGSLIERMHFTRVLRFEPGAVHYSLHEHWKLQHLCRNYMIRPQAHFFD